MTRRRFAHPTPKQASNTLADRLTAERLPLDLALSLAVEVVESVASAHQQCRAFAGLTTADLAVAPDGSIAVIAQAVPGAVSSTDTFAVGGVLYQLFTGLTPNQARARLAVSPLHDVPAASRINPAIDDTLEGVLSLLLDRDPARRPHSLRVIEALLVDVCESLELEPSRAAILNWASIAPTLRVVASPPLAPPTRSFVVLADEDVIALDDDEDENENENEDEETPAASPGPMRFDLWAVAAGAFCVVAFAMATHL
jgi:serine/threonine protein kinase